MNKNVKIVLIILVIVITAGAGYYLISQDEDDSISETAEVQENLEEVTVEDEEIIDEEVKRDVEADDMDDEIELEEVSTGLYAEYDVSLLGEGTNILFFHAGWCPTCKVLDDDIEENADDIPVDVVILKTDFDTEKDLRDRYNVNVQHTLVVVDEKGDEVGVFVGSRTLEDVLESI